MTTEQLQKQEKWLIYTILTKLIGLQMRENIKIINNEWYMYRTYHVSQIKCMNKL